MNDDELARLIEREMRNAPSPLTAVVCPDCGGAGLEIDDTFCPTCLGNGFVIDHEREPE